MDNEIKLVDSVGPGGREMIPVEEVVVSIEDVVEAVPVEVVEEAPAPKRRRKK